MTDEVDVAEDGAEEISPIFEVPVVKAKGKFVTVDASRLNAQTYKNVFLAGLKACVNTGTTKITKAYYTKDGVLDEDKMRADAYALAAKKAGELVSGTFKFTRVKADDKVDYKVKVKARQLAKDHVRRLIKDGGENVTHYAPTAITAAANQLLESAEGEIFIIDAKRILEEEKNRKTGITLAALNIKPDPEVVKKAQAKKKERKTSVPGGILSRAAAGKEVRTRH